MLTNIVARFVLASILALASVPQNETPEDRKAFDAAMGAPRNERLAALEKFLKEFPNSPLRESAQYQTAINTRDSKERQAALTRFLADFPDSRFKDEASYRLID